MTVIPTAELALLHRAYVLAVGDSGNIVAISRGGSGTFISSELTKTSSFSIPNPPRHAALSPDASELAVTAADGITAFSATTFQKSNYLNDAYESSLFGGANLFWTCARLTPMTMLLEAWDATNKTKIAKAKITDPYGQSGFFLFRHPEPDSVTVYAGAGQDGQRLWWASLRGQTIAVTPVKDLDFAGPPTFRSDGGEFLVCTENELELRSYPDGSLLEKMHGLPDDNYIDYQIHYVTDEYALVGSSEGRLFLLNIDEWSIIDEVSVAGGGDVSVFEKLPGNRFLSVHRGPNPTPDSPDRLFLWQLPL